MIKFNTIIRTTGHGYWSTAVEDVKLLGFEVMHDAIQDYGELRVYFDTDTWDVDEDGLIYTDEGFLNELRIQLSILGLPGSDVHYSEQGMQGDDYISLDIGEAFIKKYVKMMVEA